MQALLECRYLWMGSSQWKHLNILISTSFPNSQINSQCIAIKLTSNSERISNILVPCHMTDVGQVCTSYTLHIISKSQSSRHKLNAPDPRFVC